MNTTRLRVVAGIILILTLAAIPLRQQQQKDRLATEAATLRSQQERVVSLKAENEKLAAQLESAAERAQSDRNDLTRLRGRAEAMRQTEQENARLKAQYKRMQKAEDVKAAEDFDGNAALHWTTAVLSYARAHEGRFPASLQDVVSLLPDEFSAEMAPKIAATADRYELVYQGTLDGLTNPPPEATIIVRAKQPMQNTNGGWTMEYGMGDGTGLFHKEPNGNFDRFESTHFSKATGR